MRWPRLSHLAIVAAVLAGCVGAGDLAGRYLIEIRQAQHIDELSQIALRRAEDTARYGLRALADVTNASADCDAATMQGVRLHVYRHSLVKDIRVVSRDASVLCSAFSETLEFDKGWVTRDEMLDMQDANALMFRVEQFYGTALGIMVDKSPELGVVAIVGLNDSNFDIMPDTLRGASQVELRLANGIRLASTGEWTEAATDVRHVQRSASFPLEISMRIRPEALAQWDRETYWATVGLAALLGMIFGWLAARALLRPLTPLEELDRGIAAGEIRPYFQPLFDLASGNIVGAELLARWIKPDGTVVAPNRFIELAEESGRIGELTWHLMRAGLGELRELMSADKRFKLSVNISPRHFVTPDFVPSLRAVVHGCGVATRQVTLELTERESFEDAARAAEIVAAVHELGFKVALDDVGIGHSGLSQIQRLRADVLKVDKFFVDTLCRDDSARIMVETLVRLAAEMNMDVVAEGIESDEQSRALAQCGVTTGQGYVMSRPLAPDAFRSFMREHPAKAERPARHRAA
ncbi:MAG: EAL domain-containing protein [Rhizobiaceae bacterium]|nr:EAL domain-containing protein [Rhizobiaceae bacterium]